MMSGVGAPSGMYSGMVNVQRVDGQGAPVPEGAVLSGAARGRGLQSLKWV